MHDNTIDERLRSTLRREADSLPLTITTEELERRLALRRRDRAGRRVGLLAAGIAVIAVGGFALAAGLWRGPDVATTPQPSVQPSVGRPSSEPTSGPSAPSAVLPSLEPTAGNVDYQRANQLADPSSTDTVPSTNVLSGFRTSAREASVNVACQGPDALVVHWGSPENPTAIADETVTCDSTIASFRYDIGARQPMIGTYLWIEATPRTGYTVLVETFGFLNDPRPATIPSMATPPGTVVLDTQSTPGGAPSVEGAIRVGTVPPKQAYDVAMVCLGTGSAQWSVGAVNSRDFIDRGEVPCDGAPYGFESQPGMPAKTSAVYVTADAGAAWHLVITDPFSLGQTFIPPSLNMWAKADLSGKPTSGPAHCVGYDGSSDSCGLVPTARDGAAVVTAARGGHVTLRVDDGWTIRQSKVDVADRAAVRKDPISPESREFAFLDDGSGQLTGSGDRMTLSLAGLDRGEWLFIVTIQAEKGSHSFGATYILPVRIE